MVLSTSASQLPGPAASTVQSGSRGRVAPTPASDMPTTTQQVAGPAAAAAAEQLCHDSLQADLAFLEAVLKGNALRPPPALDCLPSVAGFLASKAALGALEGAAPQPQLPAIGSGVLGGLLRMGRGAPAPPFLQAPSSGPGASLHPQLHASMSGSALLGMAAQPPPPSQQQQQQPLQSGSQGSAHLQSSRSLDVARQSSLGQKWPPDPAFGLGQPVPQLRRSLSQPQPALLDSPQQPALRQEGGQRPQQKHTAQQEQGSLGNVADGDEDITEAEFSLMHFLRMYQAGLSRQPGGNRSSQPAPLSLAESIPSLAHLEQLAAAAAAELQPELSVGSKGAALSTSRSQPLPQQHQPQQRQRQQQQPPWDAALALLHEPPPTWHPSLSEPAAGAAGRRQQPFSAADAAHGLHAQHLRKAWSLPERFHAQAQQQGQQQAQQVMGWEGAPLEGGPLTGPFHSSAHQRHLTLPAAAAPRPAAAPGPLLAPLATQHSLPQVGEVRAKEAAQPQPTASMSRSTTASAASSLDAQATASTGSRQRSRAGMLPGAASRARQQEQQEQQQQQHRQAQLANGHLGQGIGGHAEQPGAKRQRVAAAVPDSCGGRLGAAGKSRPHATVPQRGAQAPGFAAGEQPPTPCRHVHEGRAQLSAAQQQQQQQQQQWQWQLQQLQARAAPPALPQSFAVQPGSPPPAWPASGAAAGTALASAGGWPANASQLQLLSNSALPDLSTPVAGSHQAQQHSMQSQQAAQQQAGMQQSPTPGAAALRSQCSGGGSGGGSSGSGRASARGQQPAPPQLPDGTKVLRTLFQESGMHMARKAPQGAAAAAAAAAAQQVENGLICAVQLVQAPGAAAAQPSLRVLLYRPASGEVVAVKDGVRAEEAELCPELVHGSAAWDSGDGWLLLFDLTHQPRRFFQALCSPLTP